MSVCGERERKKKDEEIKDRRKRRRRGRKIKRQEEKDFYHREGERRKDVQKMGKRTGKNGSNQNKGRKRGTWKNGEAKIFHVAKE